MQKLICLVYLTMCSNYSVDLNPFRFHIFVHRYTLYEQSQHNTSMTNSFDYYSARRWATVNFMELLHVDETTCLLYNIICIIGLNIYIYICKGTHQIIKHWSYLNMPLSINDINWDFLDRSTTFKQKSLTSYSFQRKDFHMVRAEKTFFTTLHMYKGFEYFNNILYPCTLYSLPEHGNQIS